MPIPGSWTKMKSLDSAHRTCRWVSCSRTSRTDSRNRACPITTARTRCRRSEWIRSGLPAARTSLSRPGFSVGIGETPKEVVDSLFALADLQTENGHIQEFIIQNFRAKANTRMRFSPEPDIPYFVRVVALARWILGPEANLQVPPNLTDDFSVYLDAGINDWGGVSPLTIDWVNPEAPWPHLDELERVTVSHGFELRPRLPVYPEYVTEEWIDAGLLTSVVTRSDANGYAAIPRRTPAQ